MRWEICIYDGHGEALIFGSIKVEELTTTFWAIFNLFGHHEIHETALATSHYKNILFLYDLSLFVGWRGACRLRWRLFAVVPAFFFRLIILSSSSSSWILLCFHPIPPVYVINFPRLLINLQSINIIITILLIHLLA